MEPFAALLDDLLAGENARDDEFSAAAATFLENRHVGRWALQLAENGYGLAMGRRPVVDDWLTKDRLIAPFGGANPTGAAYYLCKPTNHSLTAAARRVERWLLEMADDWDDPTAARGTA